MGPVTLRVFLGRNKTRLSRLTLPRRPLRMKSEASVSALRKLKPTQLQPAREPSKRWKSASKNLLTNLMRKLKCTRDNLKNRRLFPTPTLCVSRSSSVSSKALKQEQRKPNPHLTNSDQENVFLLLHQFVLRNPLMSRNLKSL